METFLQPVNEKLIHTLEHLKKELASIRAGRANPSLIEEMPIEAYGGRMKLMELGTITAPQTSMLQIQVWDNDVVKTIEKAIQESSLGLTPNTEGQIIRLPIPPLSAERRQEFIKIAHQKGEECRIAIRQIRGDERSAWEKLKTDGEIGEDELFRREKMLQDLLDKVTDQISELVKVKESELTQI